MRRRRLTTAKIRPGQPKDRSWGAAKRRPLPDGSCGRGGVPESTDLQFAAYEAAGETDVLHYALDIEISNLNPGSNTCTITGSNTMTIQSKSAGLVEFTFRLRSQFSITASYVNGGTPVTVTTQSSTTRLATLDRAYGMDETFTLTIEYTGGTVSQGFGSITVGTQSGTPVVATLSEPYYSHTWWPVKDGDVAQPGDNSDKATIDLWLTTPNSFAVPANGLLQGVDDLGGGRLRYRWSTNYQTVPYLVSFAATDYNTWIQTYTHPAGTMPVEFYIYPANDTSYRRSQWEKVLNMLPVFAGVYGEYPFIDEKYGIYNFSFGGGMEHQTMTGQGTFSESVTAHELAHQWWGDMITCKTWSDIWLNEGFATYSECIWEERKGGGTNPTAYFNAVQQHKPSSVNGTVYVDPSDMGNLYRIFSGTFSYYKGCWVLHQLRGVVGDTAFFDILADYRSAYAFSAATTDEFAAVASATSGVDLTGFFDQWVYQPGAPAYQYGWQVVNVAGQDYLLASISQTQGGSYPNVFTMPVDLVATIGGSDEAVTVTNDARDEWFVVPTGGSVTALQFDPNEWILRTSASDVGYQPGPPTIVATNPAPGAAVWAGNDSDQIIVTFHTSVNVVPGDFLLVGNTTGSQSFTIASTGDVNPVVLDLASLLAVDTYTLTVGAGVTGADSGLALDGEIADPEDPNALPSGEGVPGGDATIVFAVAIGIVPSDLDGDGDVDVGDFLTFSNCFNGGLNPPTPTCQNPAADEDGDGDVDTDDFLTFSTCFNGSLNPPACL